VDYADAIADLTANCAQDVANALRELLQRRHLYQSVQVKLCVLTNFEIAAKVLKEQPASASEVGARLQSGP